MVIKHGIGLAKNTHGKTQKNFLANTIDEEMEAQTTDKWRKDVMDDS